MGMYNARPNSGHGATGPALPSTVRLVRHCQPPSGRDPAATAWRRHIAQSFLSAAQLCAEGQQENVYFNKTCAAECMYRSIEGGGVRSILILIGSRSRDRFYAHLTMGMLVYLSLEFQRKWHGMECEKETMTVIIQL